MSSSNNKKVAVVTGANRGIGLQIVKNLCKQLDDAAWDVILTSRNEQRGVAALAEVSHAPYAPKFHQLDIDDHSSIVKLCNNLEKTNGGLDVLVQNGAVLLRHSEANLTEISETTLKTNYWGVRDLCRTLLPIVRDNGRIVLLASRLGVIYLIKDADIRKRLLSDDLEMDELDKLMENYVEAAKLHDAGKQNEDRVWDDKAFLQPYGAYGVSKLGVIALARVLQREADETGKKNIIVTSCCPGFIDTDMSDHTGTGTVIEGADTPTYLATLSADKSNLKGQFLGEREVIDWSEYQGREW